MKPKIIFFDMDGVLFDVGYFEEGKGIAASSWKLVADEIGAGEEEEALKGKWTKNELENFVHWVQETLKIYRKHGLTKEKFEQVINSIPLMEGAKEAVAELKKRGYLTAVITGSFKELAYRAKKELGIDFIIAACELVFDDEGKLVDEIAFPCDYHGKAKFFEALIAGLGIKAGEAAMVGDGVNDIPIAKEAGFSVAFNAREELKKHCDASIDKKDLREVLKHFE
ncbi:HAD family phosphatase [Candidatus Woesearchaeota archaeon]|nr:HAD family phosphatase [Candidatus Woesearchaeota archaeon]